MPQLQQVSTFDSRKPSSQWGYIVFFLAACFPLSFGSIGPVKDVLWIEWLAPVALAMLLFRLLMQRCSPFPKGGRLSVAAIMLLAFVAFGHYLFHPVSSQALLGAGRSSTGLRAYFQLAVCICIFFCAYWSAAHWQTHEKNWQFIIKVVLWFSLILGFARLITYLLGLELPYIKGVFIYDEGSANLKQAYRIGGLTECATLGLATLMALYRRQRVTIIMFTLLLLFIFLMVMGGGRSSMAGVVTAIFVYFVFIRKEMGKTIIIALIFIICTYLVLDTAIFSRQFGRITNVQGDFKVIQPERTMVYLEMWQIFLDHPLFGKGIGSQYVRKTLPDFVYTQVIGGGHGAFMSALALFGLAGALHLLANLFRPLLFGLKMAITARSKGDQLQAGNRMPLVFVVLSMTILFFEFLVGGNGYASFRLYLFAGIYCGVSSSQYYAI